MKLRELLVSLNETAIKIESSVPFICGGTPRDKYMGRLDNIADLDITTGDKTVDYLSQEFDIELRKKYKVTRKTMEDGHSTIFVGNLKMDFSSNFIAPNVDYYLQKMGIDEPTNLQREMFSRDFTCNTLLMELNLKDITDPTKRGFQDIKDKKIRACLAPEITLTTNRNRVVRAIYLACKLGFEIDDDIIEYVRKNPQSAKISTEKATVEKLNDAFKKDPEKAAHYINKMHLWDYIPITQQMQPFYDKAVAVPYKKAYFQGGGGVNEPTPGEKKYKSDVAIVNQPRFKEPLFRNYDLYTIPGMEDVGPGTGYHGLQNYKSVAEFLEARRQRLQPRYVADDSWIQDDGSRTKSPTVKARAELLHRIIKIAGPNYDLGKGLYSEMSDGKVDSVDQFREEDKHGPGALMTDDNEDHMMPPKEHGTSIYDWKNSPYQGKPKAPKRDSNNIDFPIDEQVNHQDEMIYPSEETYHNPTLVGPEGGKGNKSSFPSDTGTTDQSSYINSTQIAGEHSYLPLPDFEGKPDNGSELDFGRDYTEDAEFPGNLNEDDLKDLSDKYLNPAESDLVGLPDGIDPISDLDSEETQQVEQPYSGTSDIGTQPYEDKWNI